MHDEHQDKKRATKDKKRKRSGCTGLELRIAHRSLVNFKRAIKDFYEDEDSDDDDPGAVKVELEETPLTLLDDLVGWMESKINTEKLISFSSVDESVLDELNITEGRSLVYAPDVATRLGAARGLGGDHFMSSATMYAFLTMLANLLCDTSEACARAWADIFIYRASAMLTPPKHMVLNVDYGISTVLYTLSNIKTLLTGFIDYTAIVTNDEAETRVLLHRPYIDRVHKSPGVLRFYIVEAKAFTTKLAIHLPQVVAELYMSAKKLKRKHVRGTLTNGREWIFIIVSDDDDGKGASYRASESIAFVPTIELSKTVVEGPQPDAIAAILAYWIEHSYQAIGPDDWFQL